VPGREAKRLPRGRHPLSREQVESDQRIRILLAVAESMAEQGYVATPVADVIRTAGVSRETFYRLFDDKLDAFLAAFDVAGELLVEVMRSAVHSEGTPIERVERALGAYLDTIAASPGYARLFLIEVYAAGPAAMQRRHDVQALIGDELADVFGARTAASRFAGQTVVASVSAMLVGPLVAQDSDAIVALGPRVLELVRRMYEAGILSD